MPKPLQDTKMKRKTKNEDDVDDLEEFEDIQTEIIVEAFDSANPKSNKAIKKDKK